MVEHNMLAAYKLINSQLVASNQKLREEIKDKIELFNEINEDLFKYREENKSLRDMFGKLQEQFNMVMKIMGSVRDQTETVFDRINQQHLDQESEQQQRKPTAGLVYEKRRIEKPPIVDEAAILEEEDENQSMEDYKTVHSSADSDSDEEDKPRLTIKLTSPLMNRLGRRSSRNRSFDESLETIDTNKVIAAVRRSHEYLHGRESKDKSSGEEDSSKEISGTLVETTEVEATVEPIQIDDNTLKPSSVLEASSISDNSGVPSDHSIQSDLNPTTDQSLRPLGAMKRMASDSMLSSIVERTSVTITNNNKENSTVNDTISNATCSTPVAPNTRNKRQKHPKTRHELSIVSPVPVVALKPLTIANLKEHDISYETLVLQNQGKTTKRPKREVKVEQRSEQESMDSSDSKRPRRKAAPTKPLKEPTLNTKMRRK